MLRVCDIWWKARREIADAEFYLKVFHAAISQIVRIDSVPNVDVRRVYIEGLFRIKDDDKI